MDAFERDAKLLAEYIAAFEKLDDLCDLQTPPALLTYTDAYGMEHWRPRKMTTSPSALQALYQGLGLRGIGSTRFPPLYEALLLSYRWAKVDLGHYRLLANEPAEDFSPLLAAMQADVVLRATLTPNGYIQFGQGPELDYDPVCFDFRQRQENGDCRIVKIDHEEVLCNGRVGKPTELAPNFRSLVLNTIHHAAVKPNRSSNAEDRAI